MNTSSLFVSQIAPASMVERINILIIVSAGAHRQHGRSHPLQKQSQPRRFIMTPSSKGEDRRLSISRCIGFKSRRGHHILPQSNGQDTVLIRPIHQFNSSRKYQLHDSRRTPIGCFKNQGRTYEWSSLVSRVRKRRPEYLLQSHSRIITASKGNG